MSRRSRDVPNTVLLAQLGSVTRAPRHAMGPRAIADVGDWQAGREPREHFG
ncbi:hypothetical protein U1872_04370 [Sphingomonas sp. RB3P16]|uniref:hypothetical protein n=1 Tax=Parasphingomonas frigoris TaxID=3096163 RepID=UPI002FC6F73C